MNRRRFLKAMAAASGAAAVYALTGTPAGSAAAAVLQPRPVELAFQGRLLRGTPDGKVYESQDDGQSWQETTDFGNHCSVQALLERSGLVYAKVGLKNYSFLLKSADARAWRTA